MNIGLDFDDTYTRDPETWDKVIAIFRQAGHKVYVVTWRYPSEMTAVRAMLEEKVDGVYATSRQAKQRYVLKKHGVIIDVWIDDNPRAVLFTMEGVKECLE